MILNSKLTATKAKISHLLDHFITSIAQRSSTPFEFEPLQDPLDIRVLELRRIPQGEPVRCYLKTVNLANCPSFNALSYVWGVDTSTERIFCNRQSLAIRTSLNDILQRISDVALEKPRLLWVDAICINQQDDRERSQQVLLMRRIYQHAQSVLIYLGEDEEGDAELAFSLTLEIAQACCRILEIDMADVALINVRQALDNLGNHIEVTLDATKWKALERLYQRPWFQRIWTIQEAQAARPGRVRVLLGHLEFDFDTISIAACWLDWCRANRTVTGPLAGHISHINCAVIKRGPYLESISFPTLLHHTHEYKASDERDRVYGVLGFAQSHEEAASIIPDYTKSVDQVWEDVTRATVESKDGLNVLSFIQHGAAVPTHRPTWVCDFSPGTTSFVLAWIPYFMAGNLASNQRPKVVNRKLIVEAVIIDKADEVEPVFSFRSATSLEKKDLDILSRIIQKASSHVFQGIAYKPACRPDVGLSMTLTAGLRSANYRHLNNEQHFADFSKFCSRSMGAGCDPLPVAIQKSSVNPPGDADRYQNALKRVSIHRRYFQTATGYIGIGPESMAADDVICILLGARMPVVLRRVSGEDNKYLLLGECYVHGIMFGEAVANEQEVRLRCQKIQIL